MLAVLFLNMQCLLYEHPKLSRRKVTNVSVTTCLPFPGGTFLSDSMNSAGQLAHGKQGIPSKNPKTKISVSQSRNKTACTPFSISHTDILSLQKPLHSWTVCAPSSDCACPCQGIEHCAGKPTWELCSSMGSGPSLPLISLRKLLAA